MEKDRSPILLSEVLHQTHQPENDLNFSTHTYYSLHLILIRDKHQYFTTLPVVGLNSSFTCAFIFVLTSVGSPGIFSSSIAIDLIAVGFALQGTVIWRNFANHYWILKVMQNGEIIYLVEENTCSSEINCWVLGKKQYLNREPTRRKPHLHQNRISKPYTR